MTTKFLLSTALALEFLFRAGEAAAVVSTMQGGDFLFPNQSLTEACYYRTVLQSDGNLVTYVPGNHALWSSGTNGTGGYAAMQSDGNFGCNQDVHDGEPSDEGGKHRSRLESIFDVPLTVPSGLPAGF